MRKNIILILCALLLITLVVVGTDIQSVDEYYLANIDNITETSKTVYLTVDCTSVLENYKDLTPSLKNSNIIPSTGYIIEKTEYVLRDKDTVFDILNRSLRYNKIHFDYQGAMENSFNTVYVKGINNLYEYDCGPLSGWTYSVNDTFPIKGMSDYILKDKDDIKVVFSCSIGDTIKE